jgi:hypothetical protein
MTIRQQILDAMRQADERLEKLRASITAHPDAKLLEGTWTVRDCMSHVAARSIVTSIVRTVEQRMAAARAGEQVAIDINAINHGQVEERKGATAVQLVDEAKAGHRQAAAELAAISDEQLARRVPEFRGAGDVSIGEMVLRNIQRHEAGHVDTAEAAIAAVGHARA